VKAEWKRSRSGAVETVDGRWRIAPLYWGCTRPQLYELYDNGEVAANCGSQREAKTLVDRWLTEEASLRPKQRGSFTIRGVRGDCVTVSRTETPGPFLLVRTVDAEGGADLDERGRAGVVGVLSLVGARRLHASLGKLLEGF
jgi:hypothetical protein